MQFLGSRAVLARVAARLAMAATVCTPAAPAMAAPLGDCVVVPARASVSPCFGDCVGDGEVTVDEIIRAVGVVLGEQPLDVCATADESRDGAVTVDELVGSVRRSLQGCPDLSPEAIVERCPDGEEVCNVAAAVGLDRMSFGKGAAFVDIDGDDYEDIWAADSDQRAGASFGVSTLYYNRRNGTFVPVDFGIDEAHLWFNWSGSFADADNDGDPDLLLVNGGFAGPGRLYFYRNDLDVAGRFTDVTPATGIADRRTGWWGASWADFDGDARLDFVVVPRDGRPRLYRNLGDLRFEDVSVATGIVGDREFANMQNPVWFDYDRDGDLDLYLAGLTDTYLFRNDWPAGFVDVSAVVSVAGADATPIPIEAVFAAAAADFNQDGWEDLYLGRWSLQDYVLINRGDGTFERYGREVGLDMLIGDPFGAGDEDPNGYENTMGLAVGDIDDDGAPDVLVGTGNPILRSPDIVFCNEFEDPSAWSFRRCSDFVVAGHGDGQTHGIALGDPDRDGDTDIFFSIGGMTGSQGMHAAPGSRSRAAFYRRTPADAPSTVAIRLEGTTSNRDAVGATIRIDGGSTRYYTVRSSQGFQSQNSAWTTVALGAADFGTATVRWPSGHECRLTVFAGERVRVRE